MMNKIKGIFLFLIVIVAVVLGCKQSDNANTDKETILKGSTSILVDETLKPIIEDQIEVFQSGYKANIALIAKSENEVIKSFLNDSTRIAVLARPLNENEVKFFESLKIKPKTTIIGTDAIAFVSNKNNKDTLIALKDVISFMQGKGQTNIKGLVFDNLNSSTLRYLNEVAGLKSNPSKGIFSFKTNEEVLKYVSENEGMIGVVGLNWLYRPSSIVSEYLKKLNVLSVKGISSEVYVSPTQNNLAEKTYPLARDLYIVNCQGSSGLGMGFSSFVAGEIGQRIILKSGLLPIRTPGRKIIIRTNSK